MRKKQIFMIVLLTVFLTLPGCGGERKREEADLLVREKITKERSGQYIYEL